MKRFRRYIFNTLTVVSLLLILWAVGRWYDFPKIGGHLGNVGLKVYWSRKVFLHVYTAF
jgi:hypothetical protein